MAVVCNGWNGWSDRRAALRQRQPEPGVCVRCILQGGPQGGQIFDGGDTDARTGRRGPEVVNESTHRIRSAGRIEPIGARTERRVQVIRGPLEVWWDLALVSECAERGKPRLLGNTFKLVGFAREDFVGTYRSRSARGPEGRDQS